MATDHGRPIVPPRVLKTDYPVIDTDPHVKRVFGYARPSDYVIGAGVGSMSPALFWLMERMHPANASPGTFGKAMRLATAIGFFGGLFTVYNTSCKRFYGFTENSREVEMDMREMVDKVKKGEPLYGVSSLSPYMQGVAARNSRYSSLFIHVLPWFNFVNHDQHGVDTAKYYQQAERELEAERQKTASTS
ncbi:hypothetical protein RJZ56_001768 [Blastomyces dermatitidis]|uniref:NADH dehydrogenase n=3 Tax=Blastomyces TaxID=229219 RepID=A0A179V3Q2_BLAGS|nr:NADH dehydrogenase [Blastomyces gilchristii SLH14081]XP_045273691.1 NADH dehydrogenase [Blastomyces dermatitidis ER-3]EGE85280.1 NADH dehydrogenase [Blastomyces dermatitidis ATCC 18188]EQL30973.1 NADH dehydrogenase [Blastomyces dermatitidis ATCC 26199]EEQ86076.1 NADH dehydrogenase [Blastomyces dermatitidis ER-3]OAT14068.1 NADH dehydrogenase [Blastomyces gilchristii SLH14081]